MSKYKLLNYFINIILSCKTEDQFENAKYWIRTVLYLKYGYTWIDPERRDFLQNIEDMVKRRNPEFQWYLL